MFESFVLGAIQGIFEWLPVSSEGFIFLVKANFFNSTETLGGLISQALFLHLGTFFAALIYFRKDVKDLIIALFNYKKADKKKKKILNFLIISSIVSGVLGIVFLRLVEEINLDISSLSKWITIIVAGLLFITAFLQIKGGKGGDKKESDIKNKNSIILGITQAFAALPGLSRSGLTVSVLLLSNFNKKTALYLSFLMSLPIVLGGNIILNTGEVVLNVNSLIGLFTSFIFGLLTIKSLLLLAKKVNFGYFVLFFAVITLLAVFII
ncbi:undecaprenyl-diphosphate phosphatase [bacterium]|nr:undecaprenyl-diphosphate phosphatase [bacterium]